MSRYNVQNPNTKEWRCFSSVVDDYITDWMDEERYQHWREIEYGKQAGDLRSANRMTIEEVEEAIVLRRENEQIH